MDKRRVTVMTKRVGVVVTSIVLAIYTSRVFMFNGPPSLISQLGPLLAYCTFDFSLWNQFLDNYGVPFAQFLISWFYRIYLKFTLVNLIIFSTKYLPAGLYLYSFLKSIYRSSSARHKIQQIEMKDIVLQIEVVELKLCVCEAKCAELAAQVERETARLRAVRARLRDVIDADPALRETIGRLAAARRPRCYLDQHTARDHEHLKSKCLVDLLKDMSDDENGLAGKLDKIEGGEPSQYEPSETSEYTSLSEVDGQKDCRIQIIKVTNVYKVAYLKHYIKQKRLRRANKMALLKKKMENIRKLLENWHKSLNRVINDKLQGRDETSDKAMDECSKQRDSDTDSELRTSADTGADEHHPAWDHATAYGYYQDPEISESRENVESQEYTDKYYGNSYEPLEVIETREEPEYHNHRQCECYNQCQCAVLLPLVEETSSQLLTEQTLTLEHNRTRNWNQYQAPQYSQIEAQTQYKS